MLDVMYFYGLFNFVLGNVFTQLLHRLLDIIFRNIVGVIDVKMFEDHPQFLLIYEVFNRDRCSKELWVIYFAVSIFINFFDNIVNFLIGNLQIIFSDGFFELICVDVSGFIDIHLVERLPQIVKILWLQHVKKHVHGGHLEFWSTFISFEPTNYFVVHFWLNFWIESFAV